MDQSTPIRKPHTSTADLLTWSETPSSAATDSTSVPRRTNRPASGISPVMFGGQMSKEEAENVLKSAAKPCSGYKLREITGSGIFTADGESGASESNNTANSNSKTGMRYYQQAVTGMSQISFGSNDHVPPKKPITPSELSKQKELSGNLETDPDPKSKHLSDAKSKELTGHNIFGPEPEAPPRVLGARNVELQSQLDFSEDPSPKTKKASWNPSSELNGSEMKAVKKKMIHGQSSAKLKEMSGSDIFADGKASSRNYYGGDRKPPGGESSIALV